MTPKRTRVEVHPDARRLERRIPLQDHCVLTGKDFARK
jgi:hypothetical protein